MPLLVHAVVAWIGGLLVAALFPGVTPADAAPALVVLGLGLLVLARIQRGIASAATCSALAIAGVVMAQAHQRERVSCQRALSRVDSALEVAIDARTRPGAFVRGEARGVGHLSHCRMAVSLRVLKGEVAPGNIASFEGTRTITHAGLRLEGELRAGPRRAPLRAWRGRAGEAIDRLFGARAPLARALLIADQDGIDPDVRDRFAEAGLIHMLSISGLHVALIASALSVLASAMRLPRGLASALSMGIITLYVLALGAPAPAVRSAVMLATTTMVLHMQRPVHPWTALALGAVIPTWRPSVVVDLGWQLSVSGMASLVAARTVLRRIRNSTPPTAGPTESCSLQWWRRWQQRTVRWLRGLDGWRWTLLREFFAGVVASVVTAPLVAWYFGRVSLVAPFANIVASPVIAFVQPALFLALMLAPWPSLARVVADASTMPLALLDAIATHASRVPWAALHVAPTLASAVCLGLAAAAMVRATSARRPARAMTAALMLVGIAIWMPLFTRGTGHLELHMIDVGQGDALALRTPRGRWILIDAGRSWNGGDAGRRAVVPYLRRRGGEVATFILSHPHDDHVGGAASIMNAMPPALWWEPAYVGTSPAYRSALATVQQRRIPWRRAHPGDTLRIDGVLVHFLAPDSAWTTIQDDPNLASVVVAIEYGRVKWLLTGDAEAAEEVWLVERWGDQLQSSVLKVGHHGSRTSSTPAFLDAVNPRVALISVGAENRYRHPSPSVLEALSRRGVQVLRTDHDGAIIVRTNGAWQEVETAQGRWALPP